MTAARTGVPSTGVPSGIATRAVVTGATGTVGRACATALADQGCELTLIGRRRIALEVLAEELVRGERRPSVMVHDQRAGVLPDLPPSWRSERLVLVNAAAVFGPLAPFAETDLDSWTAAIEINFLGAAALIHQVLPIMIESRWGRIVQISSAAARDAPGPFNTAYAVSKVALDRLLAQLATELVGTGVTVCSLHPGEIASAMRDDIAGQSSADDRFGGWAGWADRTAAAGDDPAVAAAWVARLLDDAFAAAANGRFAYPQRDGLSETL